MDDLLEDLSNTGADLGDLQDRLSRLLDTLSMASSKYVTTNNAKLEEIAAALELLASDAENLVDAQIRALIAKHLEPGQE